VVGKPTKFVPSFTADSAAQSLKPAVKVDQWQPNPVTNRQHRQQIRHKPVTENRAEFSDNEDSIY